MSFEHSQFSRDLKMALVHYIEGESIAWEGIKNHLENMQNVDLASLLSDEEKIAFLDQCLQWVDQCLYH